MYVIKGLIAAILFCFALCAAYSQDKLPSTLLASGKQESALQLVYPNGGEQIVPGSLMPIRWGGIPAGDTVTLQYSTNKGRTWITITQKATGWKYIWRVPYNPGLQYMVRVLKPRKSTVGDEEFAAVYGLLNVEKVRWHPAGRLLAMAEGVNVRVWDRVDQKYVATKSMGTIPYHTVAWNREGTLLAAGTETGQLFIWDVASWQVVKILTIEQGAIYELFWKTGGKELLVCSAKKIQSWNTQDWTVLRELSIEGTAFGWNETGKQLAVARQYDCTVWNTDTFEKIADITDVAGGRSIAFSPDGSKIALGEFRRGRIVSTVDWKEITTLQSHTDQTGTVHSVAWSPDGRWLASGGAKEVIVHSTDKWEPVTTLSIVANARYLTSVVMGTSLDWSSDGGFLVAGGDNQVHLWDGKSFQFLYKLDDARPSAFQVFSPDGKYFSFPDIYQHGIRVCETATWNLSANFGGHTDYVRCQAWSPDSRYLASGGSDATVRIWNMATKKMDYLFSGLSGFVYSISWTADGKKLAVAHGKKLSIYQIDPDGKNFWQLVIELSDFTYDVKVVAFSPDSKQLFIRSHDNSGIWDTETWEKKKKLLIRDSDNQSAAWSPSGVYLATVVEGGIILWNTTTWKAVKTVFGAEPITWSADSRRMAVDIGDVAAVYNTESWEIETTVSKVNYTSNAYTVTLSPDGTLLATTTSSDSYGKVWKLFPDVLEEDKSDAPWSIRPVSPLVVTSPKGGEHFFPDNIIPIRWEGVAATDTVILSFSMDNGRTWKEIAKTTGLQYTWKAPDLNSRTCLIKAQARELVPDTVAAYLDIPVFSLSSTSSSGFPAEFSTSGTAVLTIHRGDGTARLWSTKFYIEEAVFVGYDSPLVAAGFLNNDQNIFTVSRKGRVTLWNADNGKELSILLDSTISGNDPVVGSVAVNPARTRLAILGRSNTYEPSFRELKIFDISTGEEIQSIVATKDMHVMKFAPDGRTLVIGGYKLQVRDASTLEILRQIDIEESEGTGALAISADGTRIATSVGGRVYDFSSLKELVKLGYTESTAYARSISFSADDRHLATSHINFYADYIVWDAKTGQREHKLVGADQNTAAVMFNPAKLQVMTAGDANRMRVWNELDEYWQEATSAALWSIGKESSDNIRLLSPNGGEVFVPGEPVTLTWSGVNARDTVALSYSTNQGKNWYSITKQATGLSYAWRAPSELTSSYRARIVYGAQPDTVFTIKNRPDVPSRLAWSHDGTKIAIMAGSIIRICNATNGQILQTFGGHTGGITDIQWSHSDKYIASSSNDSTVRVWDIFAGTETLTLPINRKVFHSYWSPDDSRIAVHQEGDYSPALVWDMARGKLLYTLAGHLSRVTDVAWSPDGKAIATCSFDGTAQLWNMADGSLQHILMGHTGYVYAVVWSHDGTKIATTSEDRTARIWNALDGNTLAVITKLKSFVFDASCSPDDSRLLLPVLDSGSGIWSVSGGLPLVPLSDFAGIHGHEPWHPDGTKVLAPVPGGAVEVRDAETGRVLSTLGSYTGTIYSVAWSPDGKYIATATADSVVRLWNIPTTASGQDVSDSLWTVRTINVSVPEVNMAGRQATINIAPNPARDETQVTFYLAQQGYARATVQDRLGRTVQVLFEGEQQPGILRSRLMLDGLAQGQYFVRLQTPTAVETAIFHISR